MQPCPLGCGLGILGSDIPFHLEKQCSLAKVECESCSEDIYVNRKDAKESHNCLKTLKEQLKLAREEIKSLKLVLSHGTPPVQRSVDGISSQYHRTLKCNLGHTLSRHQGAVAEYRGNPCCDLCVERDLNQHPHFYRCILCHFDVCDACANILG